MQYLTSLPSLAWRPGTPLFQIAYPTPSTTGIPILTPHSKQSSSVPRHLLSTSRLKSRRPVLYHCSSANVPLQTSLLDSLMPTFAPCPRLQSFCRLRVGMSVLYVSPTVRSRWALTKFSSAPATTIPTPSYLPSFLHRSQTGKELSISISTFSTPQIQR